MSYKYVLNQCKLFLLLPPFRDGLISTCKSMNFSWFNAHNQKKKYREVKNVYRKRTHTMTNFSKLERERV